MKVKFLLVALLLAGFTALAEMPQAGDAAPAFAGKDQDGKTLQLSDFAGKKVVLLYFYPKDFTGGCTKEACGFRDRIGELATNNVELIGVSFDSAESHKKFIAEYHLNFPLIADTEGQLADAYGVRMDFKPMAKRVSFLIGTDGKIIHVTDSGNPAVHFDEMKAALATQAKPALPTGKKLMD